MGQLVNCLGEGGPNILILEPKEIFYANKYTRGHDPPQPLGSFVPMSKCLKGLRFILLKALMNSINLLRQLASMFN